MIFKITIESGDTVLKVSAHGRNAQEATESAIREAVRDGLLGWQGAERATTTALEVKRINA